MSNPGKVAGTRAETATVRYLREHGWPMAERRTLTGKADKGDINSHPYLVWEVKSGVLHAPEMLRETEVERRNAGARFGILVVKPPLVGAAKPHLWWALMDETAFANLLQEGNAKTHETHMLPVSAKALKLRYELAVVKDLRTIVNPGARWTAVRVQTNKLLPNYVAVTLETMVDILAEAGYTLPFPAHL